MFMDLSTDYLELVPSSGSVHLWMTARTETQRAELREALFAFMLWRKFVTKGEPVYIPGVVERVLREYKDSIPPPKRREMRRWMHEVSAMIKDGIADDGGIISYSDGRRVRLQEHADLILNGRLLHADCPKWRDAGGRPYFAAITALLTARVQMRHTLLQAQGGLLDLAEQYDLFGVPLRRPTPAEPEPLESAESPQQDQ